MQDKKCNIDCIYCHILNDNKYNLDNNGVKHNSGFSVACDFYGDVLTEWRNCEHYIDKNSVANKIDLNKKDYVFIFIGASASGKDTAIQYLNEHYNNFIPIVSYTTRPKREGEINCRDYYFVSKNEFYKLRKEGAFFDERKYHTFDPNTKSGKNTWYYAMPKYELYKYGFKMCAVDLTGLQNCIDYLGAENIVVCWIKSDDNTRKVRAQNRGGYNQQEWERRLESDKEIFTLRNLNPFFIQGVKFNEIYNNGNLTAFYKQLDEIVEPYLQ